MVDHIYNRHEIVKFLEEELVGPSPQGELIDCTGDLSFASKEAAYRPWRQKENSEEILNRDSPTIRYGIGVLYPVNQLFSEDEVANNDFSIGSTSHTDDVDETCEKDSSSSYQSDIAEIQERQGRENDWEADDDFNLNSTNTYRQSSMAISFLAYFPEGSSLKVVATGGRYQEKKVLVDGSERRWWLRSPVRIEADFDMDSICLDGEGIVLPRRGLLQENTDGLDLRVEIFARPFSKDVRHRLITVCLINRTETSNVNTGSLFQSHFEVFAKNNAFIIPYPVVLSEKLDIEEQSLALLYRNEHTYAVGHGCAAEWYEDGAKEDKVFRVSAECLPKYEAPSITPDITDEKKDPVEASMLELAGLVDGTDGFDALIKIADLYENWIKRKYDEVAELDTTYHNAAQDHLKECKRCASRIREGILLLQTNPKAKRAFQLANFAILLQQITSRRHTRVAVFDTKSNCFTFSPAFEEIDLADLPPNIGKWRAFQIAFLLMSISSSRQDYSPDRETVELIWFPTGGGKTEAYLGLAAYSIFYRRLNDPCDKGVHVLMRYTLRLLTTQQFQRAASLACAMEYIRRKDPVSLGEEEMSIGIWLGADNTPNTRANAKASLREMNKNNREENLFVIDRCPWCGAQMGKYKPDKKRRGNGKAPNTIGYVEDNNTVVFRCVEKYCPFHEGLPVYVIDEDIYEKQPSIVIGTVDKFAMLAWKPEARSLFGIDEKGKRIKSPPGLIIQDELHLISGPLGSMVGLYETVIEQLCTDYREEKPLPPKIVCSTATIRRYKEQVCELYGRKDTMLFPPPGLDIEDSFFGRYNREPDGTLSPGKLYVGIHAPGHGSVQTTQVRVYSALLQAPVAWEKDARDPWWTVLAFFNSLRELGTTVSLFQSDIPDYLKVLRNRMGLDLKDVRYLYSIKELTSRLSNEQVPAAIKELSVECTSSNEYPIDVCLASSIIEVGIDIDRLSLMVVNGQPKSTSQYIQVTGRVGRRRERPGLVVTIYSPTKPRDRSHFERFKSYHQALYANVEPVSVTPFSKPALDRALHAAMVVYTRQAGDAFLANTPYPFPEDKISNLESIFLDRVTHIYNDDNVLDDVLEVLNKRISEWKRWKPTQWHGGNDENIPLLRVAGSYADRNVELRSWATPMSMRNVDAGCMGKILLPPCNDEED